MMQIPEEYKVAMQAIQIMPVANHTLKAVQQIYVDLWNVKYKNKTPVNTENVALYTNGSGNKSGKPWKKLKGDCNYCSIQGHKAADCHKKKAADKKNNTQANANSSVSTVSNNTHDDTK